MMGRIRPFSWEKRLVWFCWNPDGNQPRVMLNSTISSSPSQNTGME